MTRRSGWVDMLALSAILLLWLLARYFDVPLVAEAE